VVGWRSLSDNRIKGWIMQGTTAFPCFCKAGQALASGITQKGSAPLVYDIRLEHPTRASVFPLHAALQMTPGPDSLCQRAPMILQALR
jgi:hypothetical protein